MIGNPITPFFTSKSLFRHVTKIDRYVLLLYLRTVLVCFCSLGGIFVVFHAFTKMDQLLAMASDGSGMVSVMARYYGPYMVLLFDWTGAIISLMAFLFVVGWLRGTGELTATLAAGISHGRIFRPMIFAAAVLVLVQLASRELLIPNMRDALSLKASDLTGDAEQLISPSYDQANGILLEGKSIKPRSRLVLEPSFRLDGDFPGYGDVLMADTAQWMAATEEHPEGYLLQNVVDPENIDSLPSLAAGDRPVLMTSRDQVWLSTRECFVATTVNTDILQTDQSSTRLCSSAELVKRLRNPAVHNSMKTRVLLHERLIRVPLDFSLFLLGLPLVINRRGRNLFVMIGIAIGTVIGFFVLKTVASAMGGNGYLVSPAVAAWLPLIILGPFAYVRLREAHSL
ncbi:LptF/LptG family permease [Stieleria varia]|uniref:Putative permease YjgP/YjgQ family protein n=1 Tax=Stieleria varia TaxID=2528005 RepID=A0A5C6B4V7_9BACT|nr:LptF/LptG family permease [Stieleria varia]TWU05514.1 putative permease YjgP/YjgQ family protein [Stieleria varia]